MIRSLSPQKELRKKYPLSHCQMYVRGYLPPNKQVRIYNLRGTIEEDGKKNLNKHSRYTFSSPVMQETAI